MALNSTIVVDKQEKLLRRNKSFVLKNYYLPKTKV